MLSHKHSKPFLEVGSTGLFLETWVTFDDIHQHTCMLYPGPGCDMSRVVLEVTTFGTLGASGAHKMIECSIDCVSLENKLSFSLACCTLPYDPPCALPRQEMPKMTMGLSVYISILGLLNCQE